MKEGLKGPEKYLLIWLCAMVIFSHNEWELRIIFPIIYISGKENIIDFILSRYLLFQNYQETNGNVWKIVLGYCGLRVILHANQLKILL